MEELCSKRDRDGDDDDELTIPRAAMNKMIKELLPNIRVANEARELVLNCCTEFIHLISSESNDICNQLQKKTISAEHVLAALDKLGYGDFRKDAEEVMSELVCERRDIASYLFRCSQSVKRPPPSGGGRARGCRTWASPRRSC